MRPRAWAVVAALTALPLGCKKRDPLAWQAEVKKKMAAVITAHRDASLHRLDFLELLGRQIAVASPVEEPVRAAGTPREVTVAESIYDQGDALLMTPELMVERDPGPPPPLRVVERDQLGSLRRYLRAGWRDGGETAESLDRNLTRLEQLKYVFVVRVRDYRVPKLATTASGELRFAPGRVTGDAWLYALDGGAKLGAFPFDIVQQRSAYVQTSHRGEEAVRDLESNLAVDLRASLKKELQALVRGEPVGADTGPAATVKSFERDLRLALAAELPAALIRGVDIQLSGAHPVVTIRADAPGVLTADGAAPRVQAIVVKVLGADEPLVKVLGNTK